MVCNQNDDGHLCIIVTTMVFLLGLPYLKSLLSVQWLNITITHTQFHFFFSLSQYVIMMCMVENLWITFQSHISFYHHTPRCQNICVCKSAEREKSHIIKITKGNKYRTFSGWSLSLSILVSIPNIHMHIYWILSMGEKGDYYYIIWICFSSSSFFSCWNS